MKYILKKEYPGSPKLGNIIDNLENDWIENYPEFWKLVVEKVKKPLFTTEDGVDIFKDNEYYYINSNFKDPWKIINTRANYPSIINKNDLNYKRFSTKEAAEEYILLNKPCLSLNDLKQFFPDTYIPFKKGESATEDVNTKQLEDLVKSKIQQSV